MRVFVASSILLCAAGARAQGAPPLVVDLAIAAEPEAAASLEGSIADLLGGLGVATRARTVELVDPREVVTPPEMPAPALARVWIAIDAPDAVLYLADAPWERVLVRRVPIGDLGVASREQLAQIVHTAIEALLAGARIGIARAEVEAELVRPAPREIEPAPPPAPATPGPPAVPEAVAAPAPATERRLSVEAWLGVGLPLWSDGPRAGAGVFARAGVVPEGGAIRPVTSIEARWRPTVSVEQAGVELAIWSVAARVEGGVEIALAPRTTVRATAGVGLDVTSVSSRANAGTGVTPAPAREDLTAMITGAIGIGQELADWLWASAGVSVDVDLVDTRYVVLEGDRHTLVLDPWSVRPWPWVAVGGRL